MIPVARPLIGPEEKEAVERVLASGLLAQGPEVAGFETEFAALVGGRTCVAVNAGTTALHLGMLAAGIGPGDEVIVPSFTFAASANAVRLCGADPVFVDIDPDTYCLDPAAVEAALSPRTAAVMPVHLYGQPAPMEAIATIAERAGLVVVEDACQAHGATLRGRPVGAWGDLAAFSFYPTKNMTTGEGGMVVTADEAIARKVRLLRNQGMERQYENEIVGFNARMTDLGAAIGRVQLRKLAGWTEARQRNAARLTASLPELATPSIRDEASHVFHQYTVRVPRRDEVVDAIRAQGVGCGVYYPTPVHRLPAYDLALDLPMTEAAAAEVVSLPVHPGLEARDVSRVADVVAMVTEEMSVR